MEATPVKAPHDPPTESVRSTYHFENGPELVFQAVRSWIAVDRVKTACRETNSTSKNRCCETPLGGDVAKSFRPAGLSVRTSDLILSSSGKLEALFMERIADQLSLWCSCILSRNQKRGSCWAVGLGALRCDRLAVSTPCTVRRPQSARRSTALCDTLASNLKLP